MGFLSNFFHGDNDELLFFIVVFLLLFSENSFDKQCTGQEAYDHSNGLVLFFIVLFLLLFFNNFGEPQKPI